METSDGILLLSVDSTNLEEARSEALRLIRAVIAHATPEKPVDMSRYIIIRNEAGQRVAKVLFREALH